MNIEDVLREELDSLSYYTVKGVYDSNIIAYGQLCLEPMDMFFRPKKEELAYDIELKSVFGKLRDSIVYNPSDGKISKGEFRLINLRNYSFKKGLIPLEELEKLLPDTDNAKEFLRLIEERRKKIEVVGVSFK